MKLSDLELTDSQAAALLTLLNERADAMQRQAQQVAEDAARAVEAERRATMIYERVKTLARITAQLTGPVEGMNAYRMGEATWQAFIGGEGWFSTFDVATYWVAGDDERQVWVSAYVQAIRDIRAGSLDRLTADEAVVPWED